MDGEINPLPLPETGRLDAVGHDRAGRSGTPARRPKTVRWMVIVGLVLVLVLGALYGFNWYREKMITAFFAGNKPPPAAIAAVTATTQTVPRYATGIGSLAAVHQVTITPEIGGRVTEIRFAPGATVKAGDSLVQLNDAPERADLANYEAQARWAAISLQRAQILNQRQVGSREHVDQQQSQLDQVRAQISKTEAIIAQKLVKAPFAGRLGVRQVEVGQYVNPGAAVVTLTDLDHLYVNFTLPSNMRSQVAIGQEVEVTADAFPDRKFKAELTTIEPQVRSDTRTMAVQARMTNPDESLLPGMFVNAAIVLPAEPDRVVLPETAVDYTLYGDSVYVVREDGQDAAGTPLLKAFRTPVKTGMRWEGKVAVLSGVKAGETVVAAGQVKLQDGAPVQVTGNPPPQPPANPTPQ
jgi:multidrug efflux system membrane fusion protein